MPFPAASFTRTKWLGFFAELTAKLTHHNVLVVIEGCEMLKRLLTTRISIAAVLQEGDLLAHFVNSLMGGLQSERPHSESLDLGEELVYNQLDTLSFCVDLMVSLHADGDAYARLLVVARAGPLVEALLEALQKSPRSFFGLISRVLQALLRLPLGRPVPTELSESAVTESGQYNVAAQKHLDELRQLCLYHGPLLQDAADTLTVLVATTEGTRRFCAMALLNLAKKRLRKFRLRNKLGAAGAATKGTAPPAQPNESAAATVDNAADTSTQLTRDPDFEVELDDHIAAVNLSTAAGDDNDNVETHERAREGNDDGETAASAVRSKPANDHVNKSSVTAASAMDPTSTAAATAAAARTDDVSGIVDREPLEVPFELPAYLVDEVLAGVACARSHEAFFAKLDDLWCLTTADLAVVSAQLTGETLAAVERFLKVPPNTRQDRLLFVSLLQWTGHVIGGSPLTDATARASLLRDVSVALWHMLSQDLQEREAQDARRRSEQSGQHNLFMPSRQVALNRAKAQEEAEDDNDATAQSDAPPTTASTSVGGGDPVPADLLPYSMARRTTEELRLQLPSTAIVVITFFLSVEHACQLDEVARWLSASAAGGDAWSVTAHYLHRVLNARSVLLDAPTTVDGTLSETLYLSWSLKSAMTDDLTVATLASKLVAALASRRRELVCAAERSSPDPKAHPEATSTAPCTLSATTLRAAMARLSPLLLRIGIQNPTLTCASAGEAASALYLCPANPHATRFTSLGEGTLLALESCVALAAALPTGQHPADTDTVVTMEGCLLPSLQAVLRVTRDSLHAAVRAVPYRLLTHLCQSETDVEALVATTPSIWATAAASLLIDATSAVNQWETAAAAEWLTDLVARHGTRIRRALAEEAASGAPHEMVLATGVRVVRERDPIHNAWHGLGQTLLEVIAPRLLDLTSSGPLCYATAALMQLAVQLQEWVVREGGRSRTEAASVLLPRGLHSIEGWATIAQKASHANTRLVRVASLLKPPPQSQTAAATSAASTAMPRIAIASQSIKDAPRRAVYSLETLATQYAYTSALCRSLSCLLAVLHVATPSDAPQQCLEALQARRWPGELLASSFAVPAPDTVSELVARRVGLRGPLPPCDVEPLRCAYVDLVVSASDFGARWLQEAVVPFMHREAQLGGTRALTTMLPAPLLLRVSALWSRLSTASNGGASDETVRTREAGVCIAVSRLFASLLETCRASPQGNVLLAPLEPRAASLLRASCELTQHQGRAVSPASWDATRRALQCRLVQSFSGANEAALGSDWLAREATQLERDMSAVQAFVKRAAQATTTRGREAMRARLEEEALPPLLERLSLVTCVLSYAQGPLTTTTSTESGGGDASAVPRSVRQPYCAALCEALFEPVTQVAALEAVRCLILSAVGRRCLVQEVAASGEPLARTVFGRVLALTFELPSVFGSSGTSAGAGAASGARSHSSSTRAHGLEARPSSSSSQSPASPRVPLRAKDANGLATTHDDKIARAQSSSSSSKPVSSPARRRGLDEPACTDVREDESHDDTVLRLGYDVCTLACGAEASLCVPWLLKCRIMERASDLVAMHDLRWRKRTNPSAAGQVRTHYYFNTPHWQRGAAAGGDCPSEAPPGTSTTSAAAQRQHSCQRFTRLLRFIATVSLDANAQRWLFRQAPLLTVLVELAGEESAGEDGVLALLTVRNLCFQPALKTVLCQDMRVLLTLKAIAMGLTTVAPLLVAPAEEQSTVATLAAQAAAKKQRLLKNAKPSEVSAGTDETKAKKTPQPVAGALTPELRTFLVAADRNSVSLSSSALVDWATGLVSRAQRNNTRTPALVTTASPPKENAAGDEEDDEDTTTAGVSRASMRLQRQSLAVSALWSLLFDHQRGKMYVRRILLAQEPIMDVDAIEAALPRCPDRVEADMTAAVRHGLEQIQTLCGGTV